MPRPHAPTEVVLRELMAVHQNVLEVTRSLGFADQSVGSIYHLLDRYGIPRPGSEFDRMRLTPFTPDQRSIIAGMLLGDASIPALALRAQNCSLEFSHTLRQRDYGVWKASLLAPFMRKERFAKVARMVTEEKKYDAVLFSSIRHPELTELRQLFYPAGKKIVPANITDLLTIKSIALWYQDDGSLNCYPDGRFRYCLFSTAGFSVDDNYLLIEAIHHHCNITAGLISNIHSYYKSQHQLAGTGCRLYINTSDCLRFADLIRPHVHPSMLYKLPRSE